MFAPVRGQLLRRKAMILRFFLLSSLSAVMFGSGTYTGWRAARWLDPLLDAKDRSAAVSQAVSQTVRGLFNDQ